MNLKPHRALLATLALGLLTLSACGGSDSDAAASTEENLATMRETPFARYPVYRGSDADVLGILEVKTLTGLLGAGATTTPDLFRELRPALFVSESTHALKLLEIFREEQQSMALVVDEYGEIQGLVTISDLMGAVVGRLQSVENVDEDALVVTREDGSYLVDGSLSIEDLRELMGNAELPDAVDGEEEGDGEISEKTAGPSYKEEEEVEDEPAAASDEDDDMTERRSRPVEEEEDNTLSLAQMEEALKPAALERFAKANPQLLEEIAGLNAHEQQQQIEWAFEDQAQEQGLQPWELTLELIAESPEELREMRLEVHREVAEALGLSWQEYCEFNEIEDAAP